MPPNSIEPGAEQPADEGEHVDATPIVPEATPPAGAAGESVSSAPAVIAAIADDGSSSTVGRAWAPLAAVGLMGLLLVMVLGLGLVAEMNVYDTLLAEARNATRACPGVYLAYTAAIVPFRTFAWFRTATVLLSFVFVFTGAAFVLGQVRGDFTVKGSITENGSVDASSPYAGVLMMLIGALLVAATIYRSASPDVSGLDCGTNPAWSKGTGDPQKLVLREDFSLMGAEPPASAEAIPPAVPAQPESATSAGGAKQ
jgi:hypothetical protein